MPSKADSEALSAYWQPQIAAWEGSGQTQRAFCKNHNLNYHRFVYWRRKFQNRVSKGTGQSSSALVPVTWRPSPADNALSLVLPSGVELRGISLDNLPVVEQLLHRLT